MNCYSAKELADSFRTVRKNTLVIAQDLPEEKYTFRPAPDTRSPGELLAHIALAHNFQYTIRATLCDGHRREVTDENRQKSQGGVAKVLQSAATQTNGTGCVGGRQSRDGCSV